MSTAVAPAAGWRGIRAAALGTTVLLLAVAAHLAAGGSLPEPAVLLGIGVPVGCASVVIARRFRRWPSLLGFLALGQLVLHETLSASAHAPVCADGPVTVSHHRTNATVPCVGGADAHAASNGALMLLAHALAVVAVAALLAHGESVARRLWSWLRPRRTLRLPLVPAAAMPTPTRAAQAVPTSPATRDARRRGPPVRPALLVPSFA